MLYSAPGAHLCEIPPLATYGSVWRCGDCGTYWRVDALPLSTRTNWHPMGRLAVWWFKRKQARRGDGAGPGRTGVSGAGATLDSREST